MSMPHNIMDNVEFSAILKIYVRESYYINGGMYETFLSSPAACTDCYTLRLR